MPVGTREALLIIRAQDMASNVLRTIGTNFTKLDNDAAAAAAKHIGLGAAITTAGVGIATIGMAGLKFYADGISAAMEYNQQAALTLTQTQGLGITLDQVKQAGIDVAKVIPVPFKETQASLYDIFSSMDVNMSQAQTLLTAFSKGAVAGQVNLQDSSRATIGLMNAFKVPVQDVTKVMDFQFQLVKEGVGTYAEFADTIGKVSPSAVRAGQDMNTMGGMLAFLTRNGLDAAAASASAGRALDALSRPTTVTRMEGMGIAVKDAAGQFRPMTDIVQQLSDKLKGMTAPERSAALQDLFKGSGGTIQAMRFWNLATTNAQSFIDLTAQFPNAAGQMNMAYDTMFKQPQSQMQLFHNNMDILRQQLGDQFLPAVNKLAEEGIKLLTWFNNLSPHTRKMIEEIGLAVAIFLTVVGVVMTVVGIFVMLSGVLELLGTSLAAVTLTAGWIILAFIAVIAIGYLLYKHWDEIRAFAIRVWNDVYKAVKDFLDRAGADILQWTRDVKQWFQDGIDIIKGIWKDISDFWNNDIMPVIHTLGQAFTDVINAIVAVIQFLWSIFEPCFNAVKIIITDVGIVIFTIFEMIIGLIIAGLIPIFHFLEDVWNSVWKAVGKELQWFWDNILSPFLKWLGDVWHNGTLPLLNSMRESFVSVWHAIGDAVSWVWDNVIKPALNWLVGYWNGTIVPFFESSKKSWKGFWDELGKVVSGTWDTIKGVVKGGINGFIGDINGLIRGVQTGLNDIIGAYNAVPGAPNIGKVSLGQIPTLHEGGIVTGAENEVLRILLTGEGVLNRNAMSNIGQQGLHSLNSGGSVGSTMVVQPGAIQIVVNGGDGDVQQQVQDGVAAALNQIYTELRSK